MIIYKQMVFQFHIIVTTIIYQLLGNCRVCLIEIKDSMKLIVSCTTNANVIFKQHHSIS